MSTSSSHHTPPLACVIGDISMVRALGIRGIPVVVATANPGNKATRSRYCREAVITPDWARDPEGAVSTLIDWGRRQPQRPVLFYQGDFDLVGVSRHRDQLAPHFRFVLPDRNLVEILVDKLLFHERAQACGLLVPDTMTLEEGDKPEAVLERWTRYPCVLKPSVRGDWFYRLSSQRKAMRIQTRDELERSLKAIDLSRSGFLIQAPVEGGEENILSYHAYVRPDSQIIGEFTGRKIRTAPREYGLSTYLEITDDSEVLELGRSTVEKLGFTGVLKIDFKRDDNDGRIYLLEINPRFNLWHHPGSVAGVSLPEAVYQDCIGTPIDRPLGKARPGVRWMVPLSDVRAFGEYRDAGQLSAGRWLMQMLTVDVNEGLQLKDPYPAIVDLLKLLRKSMFPDTRPEQ